MRTTICGTLTARSATRGWYPGEHAWLGDYSRICRTYLPAEYRRDTALHNVIATVHVEAECDRSQQLAETEWLTADRRRNRHAERHRRARLGRYAECRGHHRRPGRQSAGPRHPHQAGDRRPARTESVRGETRSLQDPAWRKGLGLLTKYGLSWDLRVPWYHLEEAAEVCREHPDLRIVLNHTGYPLDRSKEQLAVWRRGHGGAGGAARMCGARSPA